MTDFTHKEALGKLLRYESSTLDKGKLTSLADYVKRMPSDQKEIYCLLAANRGAAEASSYFEVFKERKWEVLFLYDAWDEFVMEHLHAFEGKTLRLAEKADLNLSVKKDGALSEDAAKELAKWLKETLGDKVNEVRVSQRLVESPGVVVDSDKFMTSSMRRIMKAMKQPDGPEVPAGKHDFEINPAHPIIARLDAMRHQDAALAGSVAEQMLDNARVAAGLLEDPRAMLTRLNTLLEKVLTKD